MKTLDRQDCECGSISADRDLLEVEAAKTVALDLVTPLVGTELVSLGGALNRVAAKDLHAPAAMPFFNNSAMDGYAVSTFGLLGNGPWKLRLSETVAAGMQASDSIAESTENQTARIFTGAPVPPGFDAIIAQENCRIENGSIAFDFKPESGANIRHAGSETERGALLLAKGARIRSHHIGLLAANGYGAINVRRLPKVAVFSTGDELVEPGEKARPGQIYDCNKPMLLALFTEFGIQAVDLGALPDDRRATQELLERCRDDFDLIVSTGSVSVGERDFLKEAFLAAGGFVKNWKVAIKPGKPVMFGKLSNAVFTALPGNPFASFVGFHLFVKAQVLKLCGEMDQSVRTQAAIANFSWHRKPGRAEYFPVRVCQGRAGETPKLERLGNSVSATLFPLAFADGLGHVDPDCDVVEPGDHLLWQPFCK